MGLNPAGPFPPEKLWAHSFVTPEERVVINGYFLTEKEERRIFGPYPYPPRGIFWPDPVVYPMFLTFKKDGRPRIISNLSANGMLLSANDFISKEERNTSYPSFKEVAQAIVFVGLDTVWFCVFDIENAYRTLSVQPED